jgi:hypothetical protein
MAIKCKFSKDGFCEAMSIAACLCDEEPGPKVGAEILPDGYDRPEEIPDEPRCDCGHLFEICNHPNCPCGGDDEKDR